VEFLVDLDICEWCYLELMNILSASSQNIKISYGLCVLVCVTKAYMKLTERQRWYRKKEAYDNKNVFTGEFVQQYSLMKVYSVNYHKFVYTWFNCRDIEIIFVIVYYSYYYGCAIIGGIYWSFLQFFSCVFHFFFFCVCVCSFVVLPFEVQFFTPCGHRRYSY
jgi:hypothetical protein